MPPPRATPGHTPESATPDLPPALRSYLAASGDIAQTDPARALSGGRSNRLWRVRRASGDLVVKLYPGHNDNPLFANDAAAEALLLTHLKGTGLAPDPVASLQAPSGPVLLYAWQAGNPWQRDPGPVAKGLAALHAFPPTAGLPPAPDGSAALAAQTARILDLCQSPEAEALRTRAPRGSVSASGRSVLLHGDAVPGNILSGPEGISFIDWQSPATGDPVHDIALFLSPAMQQVYRSAPLTKDEETAFVKAYGSDATTRRYYALAPWFHWRHAAYCLWRISRGAQEYRPAMQQEISRLAATQ